jgi:hypothetical protein
VTDHLPRVSWHWAWFDFPESRPDSEWPDSDRPGQALERWVNLRLGYPDFQEFAPAGLCSASMAEDLSRFGRSA